MAQPKFTRLELQILEALWANGRASVREIQESFPEPRPAYTTIQTTVYRLERKQAVSRVRKIGNADIFEPIVARDVARLRLLDEILSFFGGRAQPMMAQLAEYPVAAPNRAQMHGSQVHNCVYVPYIDNCDATNVWLTS